VTRSATYRRRGCDRARCGDVSLMHACTPNGCGSLCCTHQAARFTGYWAAAGSPCFAERKTKKANVSHARPQPTPMTPIA
jgi:hypothetical protein